MDIVRIGFGADPGVQRNINGIVADNNFTDAVDAMYNAAMANPVVSADGQITDVAFNNEADVAAWVALNVKNPDISILFNGTVQQLLNPDGDGNALLPGGGEVQIKGNPTDGWTLVSWDGQPVPRGSGIADAVANGLARPDHCAANGGLEHLRGRLGWRSGSA